MKKSLLLAALLTLLFGSCRTGIYSVSSGQADESAVCFVASQSYNIEVDIDGVTYNTKTIKQQPQKARRDIKATANEKIKLATGRHTVKVTNYGTQIYSKEIFISATEVKIIEL